MVSVEVANIAWADSLSKTEPICVPLSRKLTKPVGVLSAKPVTLAVKVTDCPPMDGFKDDISAVVVGLGPVVIVSLSAEETLPGKFVPKYCAVME